VSRGLYSSPYLSPYLSANGSGGNPFFGDGAVVVWLGDSIVAGDSSGDLTDGGFYINGDWEAVPVHTDVGSGRTYYNEAVGGTALTTIFGAGTGIAYTAASKIAEHAGVTAVAFNGGLNDVAAGIVAGYTDAQMSTLVDNMLTAAQSVVTAAGSLPVMYISIAPREGAASWTEQEQVYVDQFNSRMAIWCNANSVLFVDSQRTLLDPTKLNEDKKTTSYNGNAGADYVHMSQTGCEALGAQIVTVATSGALNADAVATKTVLDRYSNLTAKNRNALGSFVFRQSQRDNLDNIYDLWVFGLANETDALKGIKGNVATKASISGYAGTATAHVAGEGFELHRSSATSFAYINLGISPIVLNPTYATTGLSFGVMIGATIPGTWADVSNTLLGNTGDTGAGTHCVSDIAWNRTLSKILTRIDCQFTTIDTGATITPAVGELYSAKRTGAWSASNTKTFWSAEDGAVNLTMGRDFASVYSPYNYTINGAVANAGTGSGGTEFTAAMAFLGDENINFEILTPQWSVRPRAGTDLLYSQLD
jgi:hypothetical protein